MKFFNYFKGMTLWEIFAWVCLFGLVVWIFLKMFGVINTPLVVQYGPYLGAAYVAGSAMYSLKIIREDLRELKINVRRLNRKVHEHDMDFSHIKKACPVFNREIKNC